MNNATNKTRPETTTINPGDRVRSFDFDSRDITGERACYVEGVVVAVLPDALCPETMPMVYEIKVDRQVVGGREADHAVGKTVYPPVNGVPKLFGGVTDGVEVIR